MVSRFEYQSTSKSYIFAVASAAGSMAVLSSISLFVRMLSSGKHNVIGSLVGASFNAASMVQVGFVVALTVPFIPFALAWWTAKKFMICSKWYYILGATLTSIAVARIVAPIGTFSIEVNTTQAFVSNVPYYALSGGIAGFVFWLKLAPKRYEAEE